MAVLPTPRPPEAPSAVTLRVPFPGTVYTHELVNVVPLQTGHAAAEAVPAPTRTTGPKLKDATAATRVRRDNVMRFMNPPEANESQRKIPESWPGGANEPRHDGRRFFAVSRGLLPPRDTAGGDLVTLLEAASGFEPEYGALQAPA